jgi:hypothetical protein
MAVNLYTVQFSQSRLVTTKYVLGADGESGIVDFLNCILYVCSRRCLLPPSYPDLCQPMYIIYYKYFNYNKITIN